MILNEIEQKIMGRIKEREILATALSHQMCPNCGEDLEWQCRGSAFGDDHVYLCENCKYEINVKYAKKLIQMCQPIK